MWTEIEREEDQKKLGDFMASDMSNVSISDENAENRIKLTCRTKVANHK